MTASVAAPPACLWVPPGRVGSYADDVGEVAENIGRPLLPEQLLAVDALTAYDRRGKFLTIEAGLEMPRQNGKTGGIMLPIFLWSILTDPDLFVWSAHLLDTSNKAFADWAGTAEDDQGLAKNCDWLRRRVQSISYENGSEGLAFVNHAQLDFRARSGKRGRGISGSTVGLDEWLYGTDEQAGALLPSLATRSLHGNARAYYLSSAALASSKSLRRMRARALGEDPTLTYVGWWAAGSWAEPGCLSPRCTHEVGSTGCSLDDEGLWASSNAMLGHLTSVEFLRTMRATLKPIEFGREFMGWEEPGDGGASPITRAAWRACLDPGSRIEGRKVWSADIDMDLEASSISVAGKRADGLWHVETIISEPGSDWLDAAVERVVGKYGGQVVIDPAGPVGSHKASLTNRGVEVVEINARQSAQAAGALFERATADEPTLRHIGQAPLDAAVSVAAQRFIGDAWVWGRQASSGPVSALVSASNALWGAETLPDITPSVWFFNDLDDDEEG